MNDNLGRAPQLESNQQVQESGEVIVESGEVEAERFEAPQAYLGGFGIVRGNPGFESPFAHRRSPQCVYQQFESPQAHVSAQGYPRRPSGVQNLASPSHGTKITKL